MRRVPPELVASRADNGVGFEHQRGLIMTKPQQTNTSEGDLSEGSKADHPDATAKDAAAKATAAGERKRAESEARPGSDPKNPGDFGHR
jgi:hypothetical protein